MSSVYPGAVSRSLNVILGERPAVTDFRRVDDDPDDWGPAFQRAIDAAQALGGREILVPAADAAYRVKTPIEIPHTHRNIYLKGQGEASRVERYAALPSGQGLFNIRGRHVGLWQMAIDGMVTTPVGLRYGVIGAGGDFNNNPYHPALTDNSSIWLHAGARDVTLAALTVEHTGGYACLIDAEDGDIERVLIEQWRLANCRPHLFGLTSGDMNYGSWTGGIFYRSDCTEAKPYRVRGLTVRNSKFRRATGNMVWGHCEAFHVRHENVNVIDACEFEDIGRDGVLFANVEGGECSGAIFRRIGYITRTDTDTPDPQLLADFALYAVGLDTSGYTRGVNYENNKFYSVYGGAIDLDGFRDGAVRGNFDDGTIQGSPEVDLHIGINLGDTQANGGAERITIEFNTLYWSNAAAIRLNHAKDCLARHNVIRHRGDAFEPPIRLWSDAARSKGNYIVGNDVDYTGPFACIAEQGSLDGTCRNVVWGTIVRGANAGEFAKHPDTASYAGSVAADRHLVLRSDGFSDAEANQYDSSQLLIRRAAGGAFEYSASRDGGSRVWLSVAGAAGPPGSVQYRSASEFAGDSAFLWDATAKQLRVAGIAATAAIAATVGYIQSAEGFLSLDTAANTVNVPNGGVQAWTLTSVRTDGGDQLNLIRPGVGDWRWAIDGNGSLRLNDVGAGQARAIFSSILTLAKSDATFEGGQLRLEAATGTNHGDIDWYDNSIRIFGAAAPNHIRAVFVGQPSAPAIAVLHGYVQAAEGFYSTNSAANTVNVPNGGVEAWTLTSVRTDGGDQLNLIRPGVGDWRWAIDGNGSLRLNDVGAGQARAIFSSILTLAKSDATFDGGQLRLEAATGTNHGDIDWYDNSIRIFGAAAPNHIRAVFVGQPSAPAIAVLHGYVQAAEGFYSTNSAANTVNVPNGGASAQGFFSTRNDGEDQYTFVRSAATARTFGMGVRSDGSLTIRDVTAALTRVWLHTNGQLQIAGGGSGVYGLNLVTGFMQAAEGFYSPHTAANTVHVPNGGVTAQSAALTTLFVGGHEVIPSTAIFQGLGVSCIVGGVGYGIAGAGFNPYLGGTQYFGQTLAARRVITQVRNHAGTYEYKYRDEDIRGGVITAIGAESGWTAF